MRAFVDTSALLALLDAEDADHAAVASAWQELKREDAVLTTTNYVVVETSAVCQRRLGMPAARTLQQDLEPIVDMQWVTREVHERAAVAMLAANRRDLSLVDCVSFEVMRRLDIRRAFTLDDHYREQGFDVLP